MRSPALCGVAITPDPASRWSEQSYKTLIAVGFSLSILRKEARKRLRCRIKDWKNSLPPYRYVSKPSSIASASVSLPPRRGTSAVLSEIDIVTPAYGSFAIGSAGAHDGFSRLQKRQPLSKLAKAVLKARSHHYCCQIQLHLTQNDCATDAEWFRVAASRHQSAAAVEMLDKNPVSTEVSGSGVPTVAETATLTSWKSWHTELERSLSNAYPTRFL